MPTSYHENCTKPVESRPESSREMYNRKKRKGLLRRSKTIQSQSAPSSPQPDRRSKTVTAASHFPEPRYNKSVNLLIEAKRLAREIEERKEKGELFRNVYRSSLNYGRKATSRYQGGNHSSRSVSQEDGPHSPRDSSPFLRAELLRAKAELRQSVSNGRKKELPSLPKRCEECGRTISNGLYSEHRGKPYCNVPCYSMLFSPLTCGLHDKTSEDGDSKNQLTEEQKRLRNSLVPKLRIYNTYYAEKPSQVSCKEADSEFILSGVLKVYWGLKHPVTLRATDTSYWRNFHPENGLKREFPYDRDEVDGKRSQINSRPLSRTRSGGSSRTPDSSKDVTNVISPPNGVVNGGMSGRRRRTSPSVRRGRGKIEKTSFVPPYGTPTTLRLTNKVYTLDVVKMLLNKFQISDKAEKFTLFIVYESGGVRKLKEEDIPILVRVNLGPCEDVAKIFIMERADQKEIPHEVAQFGKFAMHELENFLIKFTEEEEREVDKLRERYRKYKQTVEDRMAEIERASPVTRL